MHQVLIWNVVAVKCILDRLNGILDITSHYDILVFNAVFPTHPDKIDDGSDFLISVVIDLILRTVTVHKRDISCETFRRTIEIIKCATIHHICCSPLDFFCGPVVYAQPLAPLASDIDSYLAECNLPIVVNSLIRVSDEEKVIRAFLDKSPQKS